MKIAKWMLVLVSLGCLQNAARAQDIGPQLDRAEMLYYEARFAESVELLLSLSNSFGEAPERREDRIRIELLLAVSYIGLNELAEAHLRFMELLELDPDYVLDERMFSPKVVTLFDEAQTAFEEGRCLSLCRAASRQLESADAAGLLAAVESGASCQCMAATALDAAEFFFARGDEAYESEDYQAALDELNHALNFNSDHASAQEYVRMIKADLERQRTQLVAAWERQIESGTYGEAATSYERLLSLNLEGRADAETAQVRTEHRQTMLAQLDSWREACAGHDVAAMEELEQEVARLSPDASLGEELAARMSCAVEGCFQMSAADAIHRIVFRVSPEIPSPTGLPPATLVRARLRIDADGNVTVQSFQGGAPAVNESIRETLEQWTFTPAVIGGEGHCVQTELSFLVGP